VIKLARTLEQTSVVSNLQELKHAASELPKKIRHYILNSRPDRECEIPCSCIRPTAAAGHIASSLQEIVYACKENGRQQVVYEPKKKIRIYPRGLGILQDLLRD